VSLVCAREAWCSVFVGGDRCAVRLEETEKISAWLPFCPVQSSQVNGRSDHDLGASKFEVPGWMDGCRAVRMHPCILNVGDLIYILV
jgi:hypothetical protein